MDSSLTQIRRIQLKQLEILKVFQDICRKHNLRYFAIGGTCLGAVRHKGFIPWDDDVDVAMPYEDYVKFLELSKTELPEYYSIFNPMNSKHCVFYCFYKVQDDRTAMIEPDSKNHPDQYTGIFIDIFALQGFPDGRLHQKLLKFISASCRNLNAALRRSPFEPPTTNSRKRWFFVLPILLLLSPLKLILPYNYFAVLREKFISKYKFGSCKQIMFPWRSNNHNKFGWYSNIFPYEDFSETIDLPFEDTTIAVPKGYDRYLTMEFGDYMTPPEGKAKDAHHSDGGIIDFSRPYTYYKNHPEAVKC